MTIDEPTTAPAPIPVAQELTLDDDATEQTMALGHLNPDEEPSRAWSQSQGQTQSQVDDDIAAPAPPDVDEAVGPTTEQRPLLDHLPTAAPRRSVESDLPTEPGLGADPAAATEPEPVEESSPPPERRLQTTQLAGRAAGMGLLVVLLLLLALGTGIGYLLFRLSGLSVRSRPYVATAPASRRA